MKAKNKTRLNKNMFTKKELKDTSEDSNDVSYNIIKFVVDRMKLKKRGRMSLNIFWVLFFLVAFIMFLIKGYKQRNNLYQLIALNSFVAMTIQLKEVLPTTWNNSINIFRIFVGLLLISIVFYHDFKYRE